jgi:L-methionine (R)-S-oxide reductase
VAPVSEVVLPDRPPQDPEEAYPFLLEQVRAVLEGERDPVANTANVAALLGWGLDRIVWAGFYFVRGRELVLGPFWGRPACVRIAYGRGVCGTAWERGETVVVEDVRTFPGHIACDPRSRSEVVVPVRWQGRVVAVLDVDSGEVGRFGAPEERLLDQVAQAVAQGCDWA